MIQNNNNLSVLPFYPDIEFQNHRKSYAFGSIYPLYTPDRRPLPFQIVRPLGATSQVFELYQADGDFVADITLQMNETGFEIKDFSTYSVYIYTSSMPLNIDTPEGSYYIKLTETLNGQTVSLFSEVFQFVRTTDRFLKLEWWDTEDLIFEDGKGRIVYTDPNFKNVVYLNTELGKPDYSFEEEGEERDGMFFAEKQVSEKVYKFTYLSPEYLLDAMRLVRLADNIQVTSGEKFYKIDQFLITPTWQVQGDLASVETEFECATVVKKIGRGVEDTDGPDFNDDYDDDFDSPEGGDTPVTPTSLRCAIAIAVFETVALGVYNGVGPWTLQWSLDGGANWQDGETLSVLRPKSGPVNGAPDSDGELYYTATQTGTYLFRVKTATEISLPVSQFVNVLNAPNLSIGISLISQNIANIGVFGGSNQWSLQVSSDGGSTFVNVETRTQLRPRSIGTATPSSSGELRFTASEAGTYFFRVISGSLTSNVISATLSFTLNPQFVFIARSTSSINFAAIGVSGGFAQWKLQFSTNSGATWQDGETRTILRPLSQGTEYPSGAGELHFTATTPQNYFFRVLSGDSFQLTSNLIQINLAGASGPGDVPVGDWVFFNNLNEGQQLPNFNVFSLDSNNMRFNVQRPFLANYAHGFDMMMMAAENPAPGSFQAFTAWQQQELRIPGTANNVFKKGPVSYFFKPFGLVSDLATPLFDFHRLLPVFTLPAGKLMVFQPGVAQRAFYNNQFNTSSGFAPLLINKPAHLAMLQRGCTHVRGVADTNPQNTLKFLGDVWLLELGYPPDGTNPTPSQEDHIARVYQWSLVTTPQQILNLWVNIHLGDPNSENYVGNVGYYLWNFELQQAWPKANPSHFNAFIELLTDYTAINVPNLQVAIWRFAAAKLTNFSDTTNLYTQFNYLLQNPNLTSAQTRTYIDGSVIGANNGVQYNEGLFDCKAVQQVGFYQTFLGSRENPAVYLFNYLMVKRFSPESKVLAIYWPDIEPVIGSDFGGANVTRVVNGNSRTINTKPRVGWTAMQTLACWSMAFGDGADLWEIVTWNDDPREWNFTDPLYNVPGGNALPNTYPYASLKGIDWWMFGIWSVSQNKDIIEANTPWTFVNNSAWVLFSNAEFQDPVIGWKLSSDGTKALVMISDFSRRLPEVRQHTVNINGTNYTVETYYRYTTVARIDL